MKAQVLPIGFSLATGLVLGLGFGHWRGAIVNTAASIIVNELRVLTQPTSTRDALEQYRRDSGRVFAPRERSLSWSLAISSNGCTLIGWF